MVACPCELYFTKWRFPLPSTIISKKSSDILYSSILGVFLGIILQTIRPPTRLTPYNFLGVYWICVRKLERPHTNRWTLLIISLLHSRWWDRWKHSNDEAQWQMMGHTLGIFASNLHNTVTLHNSKILVDTLSKLVFPSRKLLRRVSHPEIQLGVGFYSEFLERNHQFYFEL